MYRRAFINACDMLCVSANDDDGPLKIKKRKKKKQIK